MGSFAEGGEAVEAQQIPLVAALAGGALMPLPVDPLGSCHQVEMAIATQERERVLATECGDPNVVGRNGFADPF